MSEINNKFDFSIFSSPKDILIKKIALSFLGVMFIGFAIAFNKMANLGNDPISVFLDGVRNLINNLTGYNNFGLATNIVNISLLMILLFIGRSYVNIGTLIYSLPMGALVSLGFYIYSALGFNTDLLWVRILSSVLGCLMLFLGIAIFIAVDIGLDSWSGITMCICNRLGKPFKFIKVAFDIFCIVIGALLGGTLGVVTIVAAVVGGPVINGMSVFIKKNILD